MADDIVQRLNVEIEAESWGLLVDARNEIERLRAECDAERELADQLASHLKWALKCVGSLPMPHRSTFDARTAEVVAAYEEARRG